MTKTFHKRQCIVADGTVAGLPRSMSLHGRAAVTWDEAAHVYDALPIWNEGASGVHCLLKMKQNN
jgi:hypothetical protein